MTKKKPTYDELTTHLQNNHFYPTGKTTEKGKTTELTVDVSPIMQDSKQARLEEVLEGWPVQIDRDTKNQCLRIKIKL